MHIGIVDKYGMEKQVKGRGDGGVKTGDSVRADRVRERLNVRGTFC